MLSSTFLNLVVVYVPPALQCGLCIVCSVCVGAPIGTFLSGVHSSALSHVGQCMHDSCMLVVVSCMPVVLHATCIVREPELPTATKLARAHARA